MTAIPPPTQPTVDAIWRAREAAAADRQEYLTGGISASLVGNDCDRALFYELRSFWDETDPQKVARRDRIASIEIIEGQPAEVILTHASAIGADMILMGSHEHGLVHTFLGTVAMRVMRRAHIPTLIIPYPDASERPNR